MSLPHKRMGIVQAQQSVARSVPRGVASVAQFAEDVTERYAPRAIVASQADLALAHGPAGDVNIFHGDSRFHIAPSIRVDRRASFADAPRQLAVADHRGERFGESEAQALFGRLFSRQTRVSHLPSFATSGPQARSMPGVAPSQRAERSASNGPVERHLPRAALAASTQVPVEIPLPLRAEIIDKDWGTPLASPAEPRPVVLAPREVKRVAEQVMHEINHRVTAQRERQGRR